LPSCFGFDSPDQLVKHPAPAFYPNLEERERALDTLRTDRRLVGYESTVRRLDGTLLSISENAVGTFDDHGELVRITGFVLDRSNVKNWRNSCGRSQRLEAVGQLAGGIAHDFNNLLTVIIGCADSAARRAVAGGRRRTRCARRAVKGGKARRGADATAAGVRPAAGAAAASPRSERGASKHPHDAAAPRPREYRHHPQSNPGIDRVRVDPGQLDQVIMNLVMNSGDAMPKGGTIAVSTANKVLTDAHTKVHPYVRPGRFVSLEVVDTGTGMDAATVARAFEPFFTTKPQGKGTGLGLSTVYGIVKQSGGYVWLNSEPGSGTRGQCLFYRLVESQ
jgi:signal transduction histidine kinase